MPQIRWPQYFWRWCVGAVVLGLFVALNWPVPISGPRAAMPNAGRTQTVLGWLLGQLAPAKPTQGIQGPFVSEPVVPAVFNGDLRDLPQLKPELLPLRPEHELPFEEAGKPPRLPDPVVQTSAAVDAMPTPLMNFAGMNFGNNGAGWPPDTNGDVGPNHYIQTVNSSIGIYSKTTGAAITVLSLDTFFTGPNGTPCDNNNQGDPIVIYDTMADRWLVSDFAWGGGGAPYYECIAISQTGDPVAGGWYFYAFLADNASLNDYPKFGLWPDAYYMTANMFPDAGGFDGTYVWAFNRAAMLAGSPLTAIKFTTGAAFGSLLPSNLRGTLPPAGSPNYLLALDAGRLSMWKFQANFTTPANSTFAGPIPITTAPYIQPAGSVAQQNTANQLDTLGDRLMMQLQYRRINGIESLWAAHTVDTGSTLGIRWYEIRNFAGSTPTVYQQGSFQPDSAARWMPSLAVDRQGNMAVGYSVSSGTSFPSIRYAGRLAGDPLNLLAQGEATLISGTGSQTTYNRWGDYSAMTVDPVDDCTFWYTTEYMAATGTNWQTRIGSFKFPLCTNAAQGITGVVRSSTTSQPINNARVIATNGAGQSASLVNNADGTYGFQLPTGAYTLATTAYGYAPGNFPNITVNGGVTTTQNLNLIPAATYTVSGRVTDARTGWPLYAQVALKGYPNDYPGAPIWTDPATGWYTIALPAHISFTFSSQAWAAGYNAAANEVGLLTSNQTVNFALSSNPAECTAPGYVPTIAYSHDFEANNGSFTGTTPWAWGTPSASPGPGAAHSGTNLWATNLTGEYGDNTNATLTSANINLSAHAGRSPIVQWWQWLQTETGYDFVYLEVSNNGGTSYNRVYTATGDVDLSWARRGVLLDPSYAVNNFRVRFRLVSDGSVTAPGWYVDDIRVLVACDPQAGGLVVGNTYVGTVASPVAGAVITNSVGLSTTSQTTPLDPANPDSFYTLFSPSGSQVFTGTYMTSAPIITPTNVVQSSTVRLDFFFQPALNYRRYLPMITK